MVEKIENRDIIFMFLLGVICLVIGTILFFNTKLLWLWNFLGFLSGIIGVGLIISTIFLSFLNSKSNKDLI